MGRLRRVRVSPVQDSRGADGCHGPGPHGRVRCSGGEGRGEGPGAERRPERVPWLLLRQLNRVAPVAVRVLPVQEPITARGSH